MAITKETVIEIEVVLNTFKLRLTVLKKTLF